MTKRVAILGAGPSALAVAHAAYLAGNWVHIFARGEKSRLFGCQYLHAPMPEIEVDSTTVRYELWGTAEGYRKKIYGDAWEGKVSPEDLMGQHTAWDIRGAYNQLWDLYVANRGRAAFTEAEINAETLGESASLRGEAYFSNVISTIPAPALCAKKGQHTFFSSEIWAVGDAPEHGQLSPVTAPQNTILCSGEESPSWYRVSNVFGMTTAEWPIHTKPPIPYMSKVTKPLYTDCDCFPNVVRMGRYGAWTKGELVHQVFEKATELFNG